MNSSSELIYNPDQLKGIEALKQFKKDKTKREFTLSGIAGTGKTTIIQEIFKNKHGNINGDVLGVTIAHKARINISNSISNSTTAASALSLQINYDELGKISFIPKEKDKFPPIAEYKHIVFDEASMIDDKLRAEILKKADSKAKIYYLGDYHQLPPINDDDRDIDSPVFQIPGYELTTKVRQDEGDYISELADRTVKYIDSNHSINWLSTLVTKYNQDLKKGYAVMDYGQALWSFVKRFKEGCNCRMTAYRNKRIDDLNKAVRSAMGYHDLYVPGELLIANSQYEIDRCPVWFNGEDLWVKGIEIIKYQGLTCFALDVDKEYPAMIVHPNDFKNYLKKCYKLRDEAIKDNRLWKVYYDYKNKFADVSYGYAVNNYKIQGTTLHSCYVDIHDPLSISCLSNKRKLQALYVGFTRPTHNLAIF